MKITWKNTKVPALAAVAAMGFAGCAIGPNYERASAPVPAFYKDAELGKWQVSNPQDQIAKGTWWEIFGDPTLNELEQDATHNNQELKAAVARVAQARSTARIAESDLFPSVEAGASAARVRTSPNEANPFPKNNFDNFHVPLDLSYELDIWGKVRRAFEAAQAEAKASLATYETILLTLKADVARNYFVLRSLDSERAILQETIELRRESLKLIKARYEGGTANDLDVARAETELAATESEYVGLGKDRAALENALAVLVGKNASEFKLAESSMLTQPPIVPPGLPSELLERRPDVAASERLMAAENARIGVAKAAFFPVVHLTGEAGFNSGDIANLFSWQSRAWSFGPSVSLPIFEGGRNLANLKRERAAYEEAVARFRQQVLVAFQEVEDELSGLRILGERESVQARAVEASKRAADLSRKRYDAGLVSYFEVVDSDRTKLANEREAVQIQGQRLVASVLLVKALGGGWESRQP